MRGLLGRRSLAAGEGMLLQPAPSIHTAFMRFAIDAVFMDGTFRVLKVAEQLRPFRAASAHRARIVLELAAGVSAATEIAVGDQLGIVEVTDQLGAFVASPSLPDGQESSPGLTAVGEPASHELRSRDGEGRQQLDPGLPHGSDRVDVLLIGADRRFRTVAAALLARRGYAVTLADRTTNVADLALGTSPEVVIFDAGSSLTEGARAAAQIEALDASVGIVVVADQAENTFSAMQVLAKWGSFDQLYAAIERARPVGSSGRSYGSRC